MLLVAPGTGGAVTVSASKNVTVAVEVVGYETLKGKVGRRLIAVPTTKVGSAPMTSAPLRMLVAGKAGVPVGVPAALLQVTVSAGVTPSTVRVSPDGTATTAVPVVTVPAGATRTVPVVAPLASDGSVSVLASGTGSAVSVDVQGYYVADDGLAPGGRTRALPMTRIYDSRGPALKAVTPAAGATLTVPVLGRGGVPTSGVSAVFLNVIAYAPTAKGSLTIYPAGTTRPASRAVTYSTSTAVRTSVVAKVGTGGAVEVYLPAGGVHVVVDVAGYVTS